MADFAQQIFYGLAVESVSLVLGYIYRRRPIIAILILVIGTIFAGIIAFIPINNEIPVRYALFAFVFVVMLLLFISNRFNFTDPLATKSLAEKLNPPLRERLRYLDEITDNSDVEELQKASNDLVEFIENLPPNGKFYAKRIKELIQFNGGGFSFSYSPSKKELDKFQEQLKNSHKEYRQQLRKARSRVFALVDEFLQTQ